MSRRPRPSTRSAEVGSVEDERAARSDEPIAEVRKRGRVEVAELADKLEGQLKRCYRIVEIAAVGRMGLNRAAGWPTESVVCIFVIANVPWAAVFVPDAKGGLFLSRRGFRNSGVSGACCGFRLFARLGLLVMSGVGGIERGKVA